MVTMGKNFEGKIGESDILKIPVKDPRTTSTIANYINVILDFTNFNPPYWLRSDNDTGEGHWWYYFRQNNTVHVLIAEDVRKGFVNLMTRKNNNENLTREEIGSLETYAALLNTTPHIGAQQATDTYPEYILGKITTPDTKTQKKYRTKSRADNSTDNLPSNIAIITNDKYKDSLTLQQNGGAYLQPLATTDGLQYDGENLFFQGFPASEATLREINKDKDVPIEAIDLPLLRMFYSIILSDFEQNTKKLGIVNEIVTVYVPDLAAILGKKRNLSKNDITSIIEKTSSFQTIYGVIKDPDRPNGIGTAVPLLVWMGYDAESNTIQFASPYMTRLIKRIYNVSIRKDKKGSPQLKKDGTPLLEVSHSYLVKSSIVKERNKRAVEIVMIVVTTIEQSGKNTPHLKASTIINRIPQLKKTYNNTPAKHKNRVLTRAFKKAWELLETQTNLRKKYPDIILPDPNNPQNIPTTSNINKLVFEFPHS